MSSNNTPSRPDPHNLPSARSPNSATAALPTSHAAQIEVTAYDLAGNEIKASEELPAQ